MIDISVRISSAVVSFVPALLIVVFPFPSETRSSKGCLMVLIDGVFNCCQLLSIVSCQLGVRTAHAHQCE